MTTKCNGWFDVTSLTIKDIVRMKLQSVRSSVKYILEFLCIVLTIFQ